MMIACGDYVIPGNKMPPNNAEAEAAYAIFIDMIENGWLTVSSESLGDGKTRIRWELRKEQESEYEKGFNDDMQDKRELMYEGTDGKWHKKDW